LVEAEIGPVAAAAAAAAVVAAATAAAALEAWEESEVDLMASLMKSRGRNHARSHTHTTAAQPQPQGSTLVNPHAEYTAMSVAVSCAAQNAKASCHEGGSPRKKKDGERDTKITACPITDTCKQGRASEQ
jgi:hypothetical protein